MAITTLDHPVESDDLILVYNSSKRYMLVVKSAPEDQETNPTTKSVIVQRVNWHIPPLKGYWVLDGPDVFYANYGTDKDDASCLCDEHSNRRLETTLHCFLRWMESRNEAQDPRGDESLKLIINPHGRDVLKHYFEGWCPNCGDESFCPGCGPVNERFPDIRGSCGTDQACPMCMGYEFALEDRTWISKLQSIEDRCRETANEDYLESLIYDGIESAKVRYELINRRRREMGLVLEEFDEIIKKYEDTFNEFRPNRST